MFELNITSSSMNLTNLTNFTTDLVRLNLETSELEIKMNVSNMRVSKSFPVLISGVGRDCDTQG